jgi:hypothetical protein
MSVRISEMQAFAGLIVRERNPESLEFPFSELWAICPNRKRP